MSHRDRGTTASNVNFSQGPCIAALSQSDSFSGRCAGTFLDYLPIRFSSVGSEQGTFKMALYFLGTQNFASIDMRKLGSREIVAVLVRDQSVWNDDNRSRSYAARA